MTTDPLGTARANRGVALDGYASLGIATLDRARDRAQRADGWNTDGRNSPGRTFCDADGRGAHSCRSDRGLGDGRLSDRRGAGAGHAHRRDATPGLVHGRDRDLRDLDRGDLHARAPRRGAAALRHRYGARQ